ncbi:MAG: T9SS type A sorting domain-containing protein [Saprospiraceae bacterium]
MKKTIVFFLSFFLSFFAQGQSFSCGNEGMTSNFPTSTSTFDYDDWLTSMFFDPLSAAPIFSSNYEIPLHIVIVTENGVFPPFSNSISDQVDFLNSKMTNGMSFYICDIEIEEYPAYFDLSSSEQIPLYNLNHNDNAINVYYVNTLGFAGGSASNPWQPNPNSIYIKSANSIFTLPHELGHCFGLYHTHACTWLAPDPNNAPFPDCLGELVIRTGVNSNAHLAGDRMVDTPADPGPETSNLNQPGYCDPNNDCNGTDCWTTGSQPSPLLDPLGDMYDPDIFNMMSYYTTCGNDYSFTPKQLELMELVLLNHPTKDFIFNTNPNCVSQEVGVGEIEVYCELLGGPILEGQKVDIASSVGTCQEETDVNGEYTVDQSCGLLFELGADIDFSVTPKLYDPSLPYHLNQPGMTAYDLWLINQHIEGNILLNTPYKRIAADANNSGSIEGEDIDYIGDVITGKKKFFTWLGQLEGAAWRFVPSFYLNSDATFNSNFFIDPFIAEWTSPTGQTFSYIGSPDGLSPSYMDYFSGNLQNSLFSNNDNWSFRAVKIGDVNCDAPQSPYFNFGSTEPEVLARESGIKINTIENQGNSCLEKGKKGKILFSLSSEEELSSYQMGISIDDKKIKVNKVQRENDKSFSLDRFNQEDLKNGDLKTLWWNENGKASSFSQEKILFSLEIEALEDFCDLADLIKVNREILPSWFYDIDGNPIDANLFVELSSDFLVDRNQNQNLNVEVYPNPSTNQFTFEFEVEKKEEAILTIYDYFGNAIEQKIVLTKGKQTILIDDTSKLSHGLLYYKLSVNNKIAQGKIIKLK